MGSLVLKKSGLFSGPKFDNGIGFSKSFLAIQENYDKFEEFNRFIHVPSNKSFLVDDIFGIRDALRDTVNISEGAFRESLNFAKLLPLDIPQPEIMDDGFDGVSFEWKDEENEFIVTLKGKGAYIFSGIFDSGEIHGTEAIESDRFPTNVYNLIKQNF